MCLFDCLFVCVFVCAFVCLVVCSIAPSFSCSICSLACSFIRSCISLLGLGVQDICIKTKAQLEGGCEQTCVDSSNLDSHLSERMLVCVISFVRTRAALC